MSRGTPSMTALLALLAVAGYQNIDKIAEWLNAAQRKAGTPAEAPSGAGRPGNLGGARLRDLVNTFKQAGQGDVADSWVGRGANKQIAPSQLEQSIGPDVLETLSQHTGLSRDEILSRLSQNLPEAVDKYTPEGRIPTASDLSTT